MATRRSLNAGCKRRAEDHLRVGSSKKQKIQVVETIATVSAQTTIVKVFPLFEKSATKSAFRFLERQGEGTVLHGVNLKPQARTKVAAFDLDGTLIATKTGMPFPNGADDWKWWHQSVPGKLKELYDEGYAIVIISNQGGLSHTVSKRREQWEQKIGQIAKRLPEVPFHIFAATKGNQFRKPRSGMWTCLTDIYAKHEVIPDLTASFYVGDAAGRLGDHSNTDKGLAKAIGIPFHTPEEFFLTDEPATAAAAPPPLSADPGPTALSTDAPLS